MLGNRIPSQSNMLHSIGFVFIYLLFQCNVNDCLRYPNEIYIEEWIEHFASCRVEIYTDGATQLGFFNQKLPFQHPLVLSKDRGVNPEEKLGSYSRHTDHCLANLVLMFSKKPRTRVRPIDISSIDFLRSIMYIPCVQHYHLVISSSDVHEEVNVIYNLPDPGFGKGEFTHFVYIILKGNTGFPRELHKIQFKYFIIPCYPCLKLSLTKLYTNPSSLWSYTDSRRALDLSNLFESRREILKTIPHRFFLFNELMIVSSLRREEIPTAFNHMITTLQTKFSNSSVLFDDQFPNTISAQDRLKKTFNLPHVSYEREQTTCQFIPIGIRFYNFITCVRAEESTSIRVYLDPFDRSTWIGLLVTSLVVALVITRIAMTKQSALYDSLFLVFSILLENCDIPSFLQKGRTTRVIVGMCFFLWIIAANSYKGKITESVTIPKGKKTLETFNDLRNFTFLSSVRTEFRMFTQSHSMWQTFWRQAGEIRPLEDPKFNQNRQFLTKFGFDLCIALIGTQIIASMGRSMPEGERFNIVRLEQVLLMVDFPREFPNVTIEQELCKCNNSAFIDDDDKLDNFVPDFGRGEKKILFRGKEKYLKQVVGWTFSNYKKTGSLLYEFIRYLILESGILPWLIKQARVHRKSLKYSAILERGSTKVLSLSWKSNLISGLSKITMCCWSISGIVLVLELFMKMCSSWKARKTVKVKSSNFIRRNLVIDIQPESNTQISNSSQT
ncbi:unnamed protein product [Allacma fusca]|uniref:Uncharacterized protein n=1 Tax=Allacma fusca TaxID=39272 RepID=A0A8J2JRB3_9HEXA|nr:unnamed protein product [Allacma fusca]